MTKKVQIYIGTSGWSYPHWVKVFYPKNVGPTDRLIFFSHSFDTVEINNTFYHVPYESVVKNWYQSVPKQFVFSVKASRYITHLKRLKDPDKTTSLFFKSLKPLKTKLGPILFQLPPSFEKNLERLELFLKHLSKKYLYVFEFRHPSWYTADCYKLLKKYAVALCITDLGGKLSPQKVTTHFTYIRLHGPKTYRGQYGRKKLAIWKRRINNWKKNKISVYCYFDNDEKSYAVKDAKILKEILGMDSDSPHSS